MIYPLKDNNGSKISSHIILPWSWHDTQITFRKENIKSLLVNKQFLLLYSVKAKNKFNNVVKLWSLVQLTDNLRDNAKIIREYILKSQLWALQNLINTPNNFFNIEIDEKVKHDILNPIEWNCASRLATASHWFINKRAVPSIEMPKRNYHIQHHYYSNNDDGNDDSYLDDELDYIRQNGGDWIDD